MNHFIYILECAGTPYQDSTYYTGYTNNIAHRFLMHCQGAGAKYTRSRRPVKLVYIEKYPDKSSALKREYQIKQLTRNQKLQLMQHDACRITIS